MLDSGLDVSEQAIPTKFDPMLPSSNPNLIDRFAILSPVSAMKAQASA
jgi:hypothetical protein